LIFRPGRDLITWNDFSRGHTTHRGPPGPGARHDELYYRQARPEITDFEYDRLKRELADLESQFPELKAADSPTGRVGDDRLEGFATYRHRQPMQSLDNTYSEAELRAFHQRLVKLFASEELVYVVEPKIDGMAVSLTYEKGRLVRAVTRGSGIEGDDYHGQRQNPSRAPERN